MCGRFANAQSIPQYRAAVRDELPEHRAPAPAPDADDYTPSHNVAPQTRCPVVRRELSWERERRLKMLKNPTDDDHKHQLIIQTMKWGLVPRFHKKQPSYAEAYKTINARDDTILCPQRSVWHPLLPSQRCVVFVQGFYEWQKRGILGDGDKVDRIPHFVGMTEPGKGRTDKSGCGKRLMPLAGLWERVRFEGEDKPLYTFTIVTTTSNEQLGFLHDRMPVILPTEEAISTWLGIDSEPKSEGQVKAGVDVDDSWSFEVAKLLRPLQSELECYKVPKEVGKVGNSDPSFILPIEERKDGLKAFFAKQQWPKQSTDKSTSTPHPTASVEKEVQHISQDSDGLTPSSSEDAQALLAAQHVEDEAALAEVPNRAEQEEADRKMAERMQREFEESDLKQHSADMNRSESNINVGASSASDLFQSWNVNDKTQRDAEVSDSFAVPKDEGMKTRKRASSSADDTPIKRSLADPSTPPIFDDVEGSSNVPVVASSSRFSPDPYNPPVSPPRPKGGYSSQLSPASGGGIHVNPRRGKKRSKPHEPFLQAPPHGGRSSLTERGPIDELLEKQRRTAQTRQNQATSSAQTEKRSHSGGTTMKSPSKKAAGADIRSFFSLQKKA